MLYYVRRFLDWLLYPVRALFSTPGRLLSGGQRLWGISVPARVAWLIAILLLVCVALSMMLYCHRVGSAPLDVLMHHKNYAIMVTLLVIVIPIVVYHVLRLWLEGNVSPFEDIDRAWKAGMAELTRQGFDLSQTPVFLILGSCEEAQEKAMFQAARLNLSLRNVPEGPAAFHWYAASDAIYLVSTRVGCLSRLAGLGRRGPEFDAAARERAPAAAAVPDIRQTLRVGGEEIRDTPAPPLGDLGQEPRPFGGEVRGTVLTGPEAPPAAQPLESPPGPPEPAAAANIRGTLVVSGSGAGDPATGAAHGLSGQGSIRLPQQDAGLEERRLDYLCQVIRRARQPVCPINGIMVVIPFGLVERGPVEGRELQQAIKRDLTNIHRAFQLRCPVEAVVVGMEEESGFGELMRRVGPERARQNRFGRGFPLTNPPIPERVEALAIHACGAFEDWVYALFKEKGSLSRPGNARLYTLLCKIRHAVQNRLGNILVAGCSSDPDQDPHAEPLLFGGCYFAGTGETEDRQAFIKGVFDKLPLEQNELQWTQAALREDAAYQAAAQVLFGVNFLLFVAIAGMLVYNVFIK